MDVILLERIEKLGQMGDVVSVKPGYARNFLFPKKKALRASKGNLEHFESQRKELEAENLQRKSEAEDIGGRMDGLQVVIIRSAGEAGQLYGSVNARDIADAVCEEGFKIARSQVVIERPVKMLGLFDIRIRLHPEVDSAVSVNVARSEDEAEQQRQLGRAIISQEEEERQAEEEARLAAAQAAEEMFDPEAQARAADELADGEGEDGEAPAETAEAADEEAAEQSDTPSEASGGDAAGDPAEDAESAEKAD